MSKKDALLVSIAAAKSAALSSISFREEAFVITPDSLALLEHFRLLPSIRDGVVPLSLGDTTLFVNYDEASAFALSVLAYIEVIEERTTRFTTVVNAGELKEEVGPFILFNEFTSSAKEEMSD